MRYVVYYITGTFLGIILVVGICILSPETVQRFLPVESTALVAVDSKQVNQPVIPIENQTLDDAELEINHSRRNSITRAVKDVAPAVVGINVIAVKEYRYRSPFYNDPYFRQFFPDQIYRKKVENLGSGFLISEDGYILTNQHVVNAATEIVVTMTDGQKYDAETIGFDFDTDVALLKIKGHNFPFIPFGNSDNSIIGEWAIAIGNPFGLFSIHSQPTVTVGVISAVNRDFERNQDGHLYQDMVQTDASINRGNSGGPLVNSLGELIGMNTIIFTEGGGSIGLGFAIPANKLEKIFQDLLQRGSIERDFWIGAKVENVNRLIALSLRLPELRGVVITDVDISSPAAKAGLETTDVIFGVNQQKINNVAEIEQIMRNTDLRVGDQITFSVFRNGELKDYSVILEKKDD
ncbi:MAG: trypsin-like serine protease [Calditrichaeota bacterium]|nr:trypsin-like serine protease [Calditrichota bacterium]